MPVNDCILWTGYVGIHGYGSYFRKGKTILAHRESCEKVHGAPPHPKMDAAHSCHTRLCINPAHLRWATRSENMRDKVAAGTDNRGEKNSLARLTNVQARAVRESSEKGVVWARRLGVSAATISNVRRGKVYAYA